MVKNTAPAPEMELVVKESFSEYHKGDIITDPEKIAALLASEWSDHVIKKPITRA